MAATIPATSAIRIDVPRIIDELNGGENDVATTTSASGAFTVGRGISAVAAAHIYRAGEINFIADNYDRRPALASTSAI